MNFITDNKLPLGEWMKRVDWLTMNASGFFDAISIFLEIIILFVVDIFKWMPPAAPIIMTAAIAWFLHRSIPLVVLSCWRCRLSSTSATGRNAGNLVLVCCDNDFRINWRAPWHHGGASPVVNTLLRPILDLMQTVPTFVYPIPTLVLFGLGIVPGLISTIIFAIAAPIRLTYLVSPKCQKS